MVEILQVKHVCTRATPTLGTSLKGRKMFDDVHIDLSNNRDLSNMTLTEGRT